MNVYKTKAEIIRGTTLKDVLQRAKLAYAKVSGRTKRRPYIRSDYFRKQKIFLPLFWSHLHQKYAWLDKIRRLRYFLCALDLLQHSHIVPTTVQDPNQPDELLHRFTGVASNGKQFHVQVKENKRSGRKDLLSVFPAK